MQFQVSDLVIKLHPPEHGDTGLLHKNGMYLTSPSGISKESSGLELDCISITCVFLALIRLDWSYVFYMSTLNADGQIPFFFFCFKEGLPSQLTTFFRHAVIGKKSGGGGGV